MSPPADQRYRLADSVERFYACRAIIGNTHPGLPDFAAQFHEGHDGSPDLNLGIGTKGIPASGGVRGLFQATP